MVQYYQSVAFHQFHASGLRMLLDHIHSQVAECDFDCVLVLPASTDLAGWHVGLRVASLYPSAEEEVAEAAPVAVHPAVVVLLL